LRKQEYQIFVACLNNRSSGLYYLLAAIPEITQIHPPAFMVSKHTAEKIELEGVETSSAFKPNTMRIRF